MNAHNDASQSSRSGTFATGGYSPAGTDEHAEPADALVLHLNVAVTTCSIYPPTHPKAAQAISELRSTLNDHLKADGGLTKEPFSLLIVEEELAIDGKPWRRSKVLCANLQRALERHSIQRITAPPGINIDLIVEAVIALTRPEGPEPAGLLEVGKLDLLKEGQGDPTLGALSLENRVDAVRTAFDAFVQGKNPQYQPFADAVRALVDALAIGDQRVLFNAELSTDGDRLFRHSLGTALSAHALARSLGIGGDVLYEIVAGALLHDTGLLDTGEFDSSELWSEWSERASNHPVVGAGRLATVSELPPLVFLIVLQHHRRVDGTGFPRSSAKLNLGSAIVAVADAWDTLFNLAGTMPHGLRLRFTREQLIAMSGAELHPDLVALFLQVTETSTAA